MTLTFSKPSFSKVVVQATGVAEPCYTFLITASDPLTGLFESDEPLSPVEYLTRHLLVEKASWLTAFIAEFLKSSAKYFAKPYTPEVLQSRLSHTVQEKELLSECSQVSYTPFTLVIFQGQFTITWSSSREVSLISIPDADAPAASAASVASASSASASSALESAKRAQEIDQKIQSLWVKSPRQFNAGGNVIMDAVADAIPLTDSSDVVSLPLGRSSEATLDKRRVQEAALRAKLALLKAERTHAEYVQKYGQDASDESETEESGSDTEDSD